MNQKLPPHPIIIYSEPTILNYCDSLENIANTLELLEYVDVSEGMDKGAEFGLFIVLQMLGDSARYLSGQLKETAL